MNNDDDNFIIKMEKYDKKDNTRDYSISILPDGSILYDDKEKIKSNSISSKISEAALSRLIDEFIDIYFFAMDDNYIQNNNNTMLSSIIEITVKWKNKQKKVVFDKNNPQVPDGLIEFQKLIEQTISINR